MTEKQTDSNKRVIAEWYINCNASCPQCFHDIDIWQNGQVKDAGVRAGENSNISIQVVCRKCSEKFIINHVQ